MSMAAAMPVNMGPVELIVLAFPGERADPDVVEAIADVVTEGYVTVLDLVFITKSQAGRTRSIDIDGDLPATGFGSIPVGHQALISQQDMATVRDAIEPGTCAAVIVYEESWARRVASAVRTAGGDVALHLALDPDVVETAVATAG
jgi:hypothetical protein